MADDGGITGSESEPEDPDTLGGVRLPSHSEAAKILGVRPTYFGVQSRPGPIATRKLAQLALLQRQLGAEQTRRIVAMKRADEQRAAEARRLQAPDPATSAPFGANTGAGAVFESVLMDPYLR